MKILTIIPARGNSKGIPGKNIRMLDGEPLISYTIKVALSSNKLDNIWVSSDSDEILRISDVDGVHLHKRPNELATDISPVIETVNTVLKLAREKSRNDFDAIMLLQPTAPIRTIEDINNAIKELEKHPEANTIISVCALEDPHPARMYTLDDKGLQSYMPAYEQMRRQDIPIVYYRNGSIYLVRTTAFEQHQSLMVKPAFPYIMSATRMLNLDDMRDWLIAETLIPAWKKGLL